MSVEDFKSVRRNRILDAALRQFLQTGVSTTTMENIAEAASVAKPTLYAYFSDKQAILAALRDRLADAFRIQCERCFDTDQPPDLRAANALAIMHRSLHKHFAASPHGADIYPDTTNAAIHFNTWLRQRLIATLAEGGFTDPVTMTSLLWACADGIARHVQNSAEIGPAIRLIATGILRKTANQ